MLKSPTLAACVLALSGSVALAQTQPSPAPAAAPGTTTAPAPSTIGTQQPSGMVYGSQTHLTQTTGGQTTGGINGQGYGMQGQGAPGQGMRDPGLQDPDTQNQAQLPSPTDSPRGAAITDEYGNRYNSRGDRIGRGQPAAKQH